MDLLRQPKYKLWCTGFCLSMLAMNVQASSFPGVTAPYVLPNGQTLTIFSGNMQTTNNSNYTVQAGLGSTITVNSGATLSYNGTDSSGNAIRQNRDNATNSGTTDTVNNYGDIYSNGPIAIYYGNSAAAPANSVVINNYGTIEQAIYTSAPLNSTVNILTLSGDINGNINLGFAAGGSSNLNIGSADGGVTLYPANFTSKGILQNIQNFNVYSGSNLNLNTQSISITNFNVLAGATATINYPLAGSGGAISIAGTLTLSGSIYNTGSFSCSGTTIAAQNVSVNTSNFVVSGVYKSQIYDVLNYGVLNLTAATVNTISNFQLSYTGGYFPGGTYLLATGQGAIAATTFANPASQNTMFLTFGTPYVGGTGNKSVYTTITRRGYNQFVSNTLAQAVGYSLEDIGVNNPSNDMVQVLNAVELSTSSDQLQNALLQLTPLISAPIFSFQIQNQSLDQVELRIAELRNQGRSSYFAGDSSRENHIWLRPYGDYANQDELDDCFGYYATTGGVAIGFDRDLDEKYNLGIAGSYSLSRVRDKLTGDSQTNVKSYGGTLYGTYNFDESRYLDWMTGVLVNSYNATRVIAINGLFLNAQSEYDSQSFAAKGIWGKDYAAYDFLQVTPEASLLYMFNKQYTYAETGAPGANLNIQLNNNNIVQLGLGGKVSTPVLLNPGIFVPELHAMAYYNVVNPKMNTTFGFVEGGTQQIISTFSPGRSQLVLGVAFTIGVVESLEAKFNYDVLFADRLRNHAFYLNFRYLL